MRRTLHIFMLCLLLGGCDYQYEKQIGENYFIRCIESRERMDIGFGTTTTSEGLIDQTVFEVFWNDEYILAKRHPSGFGSTEIDRHIVEYYILKKVKLGEANPLENFVGPLNQDEYKKKIAEMLIKETEMEHILYDDLK